MTVCTNKRGLFIVLEGCDRTGKSTQAKLLVSNLTQRSPSRQIHRTNFPNRSTYIGGMLDSYLKNDSQLEDHAVHLLFSANRWEAVAGIKKLLDEGTDVVCDRYAFSGVAFSAAKGLSASWCKQTDVGLLRPDAVIFLKADPSQMVNRGDYGQERYEKVDFQCKVAEQYESLVDDRWKFVDANKGVDEVSDAVLQIVLDLEGRRDTEITEDLFM